MEMVDLLKTPALVLFFITVICEVLLIKVYSAVTIMDIADEKGRVNAGKKKLKPINIKKFLQNTGVLINSLVCC